MRSILLAGGLGLIGTLIGTRFAIRVLVKNGYGQFIRDDGPTAHHTKRGTPTMGGAVIILFFLPWLDTCAVKSIRYRPTWHKYLYAVFVINFLILGYLGVQPPSPVGERVSQVGTLFYFGFFLLMPWWSSLGATKPVPDRVNFTAH